MSRTAKIDHRAEAERLLAVYLPGESDLGALRRVVKANTHALLALVDEREDRTQAPSDEAPAAWITVQEAKALLRTTDRFIYNSIDAGDLPAYKLGGRKAIRLKRADVEALFQPVEKDDLR